MKYHMHFPLDYFLERRYRFASLAHRRACSRDDPEDGARRGVLRQRLITAVPGGTGPRQPGTTTRTRGARCDRSGRKSGEGSAGPEPKIATVRAPGGGRPALWDARRLASAWPAASRAGPRVSEHPYVSRRSATPSWGCAKLKFQNPGAENAPRERVGLFDIVSQQIRCPRRRLETRRRGACPRRAQRGEGAKLNP